MSQMSLFRGAPWGKYVFLMIGAFISSQEALLSALTHHGVVWVPAQEPALLPQHPVATAPAPGRCKGSGQGKKGQLIMGLQEGQRKQPATG